MLKIKRWGDLIISAGIILELALWPSVDNLAGCAMTGICWLVFSRTALDERIIREHLFGWLVFLSMSLYRILPLFATMTESHPIGYNFVIPKHTYLGETVFYLISALAFNLTVRRPNPLCGLKRLYFRCGFYDRASSTVIWALGILGLAVRLYLSSNDVEYGDIVNKSLSGITFFQYAPILLFFPDLYKKETTGKVFAYNTFSLLYLIMLVILSFATNSRYAIIEPFGTFALLFVASYLNCPRDIRPAIRKRYVIGGTVLVVFLIPVLSDISLAMLANRSIRDKVDRSELFRRTVDTYLDRNKMETLRNIESKSDGELVFRNTGSKSWSETYVGNFALNRYCNLKVTDNTLYHAENVGFADKRMRDDFWKEVVAILPTPILQFLDIDYDKNLRLSRGDKLKALSSNRHPTPSYLVTSHLADGLVTFGYWYFPVEFLLFFLRFLFLDTFMLRHGGRTYYSLFGLITIFSFLAMFRNAGGCCDSLFYLLRGYWQDMVLFIIVFYVSWKIFARK